MHYRRAWRALVLALPLAGLTACSYNKVTGEQSLLWMTQDEENKLGAEAEPQMIAQFGGKVPNQQLQDYVSRVGHKLAAVTEEHFPELPWEYTLLNSDVINAFALPGGKVFITRGLASKLTSEAQLAGVLGHETGHVTARHGNQQMSQNQIFSGGIQVAQVIAGVAGDGGTISTVSQYGVPALQMGGQVFLLKYGRKDESQADALGMRYMVKCGYNPLAQRQVMEILEREAGSGGSPEWLSTHPYPETRIKDIDGLLATTYKDTQNNPKYGMFEQEYQTQMLRVLATLPPAPKPPAADPNAAKGLQKTPPPKKK